MFNFLKCKIKNKNYKSLLIFRCYSICFKNLKASSTTNLPIIKYIHEYTYLEKFWYPWIIMCSMQSLNFFLKNFLKFPKILDIYLFRLLFKSLMLKQITNLTYNEMPLFSLLKNLDIKKSIYVQKGRKLKKIGVYMRSFFKNKETLKKLTNYCYLIMRFKRKNLFLTLLNNEGNVLCKTNIGSCGFKKKVKYTGYAIKRTSKRFSKKILGSFIKTIYFTRKNSKKRMQKIKDLIFINQKLKLIPLKFNLNNFVKKKKIKIKKIKKKKKIRLKTVFFKFWKKQLNNKKLLRKKIKKDIILKKFIKYRKYPYYRKIIQKAFKINIRVKSNFKFWGFRFVMYGLARRFRWFHGLEIRLPVPHSNGLRLKKKRRI